ncbi:Signal recognition particle protein [Vanrija pseudolonga]|uniref:Signal recognition particle subunit SRP14 n=1 Tax=Vanrija pseudolonga TaxID=143232 RepID=A0AAF0YA13_9TREE|nr:Signal recognition particle protein [Vanrija pseudolonga]
MPQELVTADEFLTRLTTAFAGPSSAIWLSHKRHTFDAGGDASMTAVDDGEAEHDVLIRCTHGETKFSARVPASSLHTFHAAYGALLKASMAPHMRKRDKKKERARADAAEQRKRELFVDVKIGAEGKRGKGRRQRMRKVAAQKKKEAERERIELRDAARKAQE